MIRSAPRSKPLAAAAAAAGSRSKQVFAFAAAFAAALVVAAPTARAHRFPPVRSVVVQVERCEVVLLVGYRAGTGEATDRLVARAAGVPRSRAPEAVRDLLASHAMAPLAVTVDGRALAPTSVRAKLSSEGDHTRPMVVVLASYTLPPGKSLAVATREPRTTRISWTDRDSHRVSLSDAPAQGRWFTGAAAFSLELTPLPPPGPASFACPASPPRPSP